MAIFFSEVMISTHTPLAGRDDDLEKRIADMPISTHTPLAGRDRLIFYAKIQA